MSPDRILTRPGLLICGHWDGGCQSLTAGFQKDGYKISLETDLQKAFAAVINGDFDLIVLGTTTSAEAACSFIGKLRKSPKSHTAVILIAGKIDKALVAKLVALRVAKILVQPADIRATVDFANQHLGYKPQAAEAPSPESGEKPDDDSYSGLEVTDEAV